MRNDAKKRKRIPSLVPGRRGGISVVDALVEVLWMEEDERWPSISLAKLRELVARRLEYDIASSTVRSAIYSRPKVFQRFKAKDGKTTYKLAASVRKQG